MMGKLHTDISNVPTHLVPGARMQIKLTKARGEIYVLGNEADSKQSSRYWKHSYW